MDVFRETDFLAFFKVKHIRNRSLRILLHQQAILQIWARKKRRTVIEDQLINNKWRRLFYSVVSLFSKLHTPLCDFCQFGLRLG
jgi:hypothetical protein